jgi:putative Mg2+ transporter-C (MgtC) family protein
MLGWYDIIFRLGSAALIGGLIGLNRDLHHKPSGLRTLSLVGLGSALAVLIPTDTATDPGATSRVLQGIITGIGFLGAGIIVHEATTAKVRGLTTAAAIWVTACLGSACGLGAWRIAAVSTAIIGFILVFGGRLEKAVHQRFSSGDTKSDEKS